jgi:DNA-binding MarR family transcriptional regulator
MTTSTTSSGVTTDSIPWLDDREQHAWRAFIAMHSQLQVRLQQEMKREHDLSGADYSVLVGVSEAPCSRIRAHELGAGLQWEKSRLSKQITRMEERGLLERQQCPTDARGSFVALTGLGRAAIEHAAPFHVRQVRAHFIDVLSPEQLDQLDAIATAILGHLDAEACGTGEPTSDPGPAVGCADDDLDGDR